MKLRYKLILFALLCSVLPLLGISTLAFDAARSSLREIVEHDLVAVARQTLHDVQQNVNDANSHLVTWGRLGIMQDVLTDDEEGDLQSELLRLAQRYVIFAELLVLNENGVVIAATESELIGTDLRGSSEFGAALKGLVYEGLVTDSNRLSHKIITQAVPIRASYDESTIIGSLVGSLDWQRIETDLSGRTLFGGVQDQTRRIILQSQVDDSILYSLENNSVSVKPLENQSSELEVRELLLDDSSYVVASARSGASEEFRDPDWTLHVILDTDVAYASIWKLRDYLIMVGAAVLVIVTFLGFLLARSSVRPINALVMAAQQLASGDFSSPLPISTNKDEVSILANSFASMRDAVKANEQELIKKTELSEETARLKGEFLANMSHEVRTPINGVLGMTELLMSTDLDEKQGRYASTIFRSGQSLLSVINDILDFSKMEAGKLELQDSAFDLRVLVEDVVEMLAESAHKKGLEIAVQLSPGCHVAYQGDASRLQQILLNLLGNAVKFTSDGEVRLCVTCFDGGHDATQIRFEVIDTGIGIAQEAQATIFESFVQADGSTTRRFGGTGLGLAISTQLVALMKGEIGVDSQPGAGSTFWFTAHVGKLPVTVENAWRETNALEGKRILIVDDNRTNREILQTQLSFWGVKYGLASSGPDALRALRAANDEQLPFDLAILDMHMPEMDGLALSASIKDDVDIAGVRLILLSSVCDMLDAASNRAIGLDSVLTKPVRQPELYSCLTAVMAQTKMAMRPAKQIRSMDFEPLHGQVLLAEDNPVNQDMMTEMLKLMGLTAMLVKNGKEAVEAVLRDQFDVVLMDCQMPVMDGFEATREIRHWEKTQSERRRTSIIALTANALQGDRENCLLNGMDEYLCKPVSSSQLHEMLSQWLSVSAENKDPSPKVLKPALVTATLESTHDGEQTEDSSARDDSPLDAYVLAEIVSMSLQAAPGFLVRLLDKFVESSADDLTQLEEAIATRQSEDVRQRAHRLKSSSANLGARHLASLCQELETAAKSNNLDESGSQLVQIKSERDRVIDALALSNENSKAA